MVKLQSKLNWALTPEMCETPVGVSETVPDDSFTIKQLMARHVRGMRLDDNVLRTPVWDAEATLDSPDVESLARMDLAEKHEYAEMLKADVERRKAEIEAVKAKLQADKIAVGEKAAKATPAPPKQAKGKSRLAVSDDIDNDEGGGDGGS